jgi:hypothetical protein
VAGRFGGVVVCFLYWSLRRLLELIVLRRRSEREKEIEILLLRHQLRVLERQVARPELTPADRMVLVALSRVLPAPGVAEVGVRDAGDASALAPRAGRAPVDVSAQASRSACERRRDPCARRAARTGEPGVGLPADPGRAGQPRYQACREHSLDDPEGGGD